MVRDLLERRDAEEEEEGRPEDRAVADPMKRRRMARDTLMVCVLGLRGLSSSGRCSVDLQTTYETSLRHCR